MDNFDNQNPNKFAEYGMLMLHELKRINNKQDELKKDLDKKFLELKEELSELKRLEKDAENLIDWKEKVSEVWSPTAMKAVLDEVYRQKNFNNKMIGIIIACQFILMILMKFGDKIFN